MSRKKKTQRRKAVLKIDDRLKEVIVTAAKSLSEARQAFAKVEDEAYRSVAKEIGYVNPGDMIEFIREEVDGTLTEYTPEGYKKSLTDYARQQHVDWEKEELENQIKALQSKRDQLEL